MSQSRGRGVLAVMLVGATLAGEATASADPPPPEPTCGPGWESLVFVRARASVVRISDGTSWGAGFAWKTPRTIVTAMHVVERGRSFDIVFFDGSKGRAHIVAGDRESDVAILELDGDAPALTPLGLGDPTSLALGAPVIAIGHPYAVETTDEREKGLRSWTITRGVLGARNDHQIQVDAALNPGNSGGPILDCEGRVIGVASHIAGTLGFATGPRAIVELDRARRLPGVSFAPTSFELHVGLALRAADVTSYGVFADADFAFFGRLRLALRGTGLLDPRSRVDGARVVTSGTGLSLYAGAGWSLRPLRRGPAVIPSVGATTVDWREHATTFTNGQPSDSSVDRATSRLTPGIAISSYPLMLDYRVEVDFGRFGDSAHVFSASIRFL